MGVLRKRIGRNRRMTLQLTSLLDMFTIILVFLMVSFQAEDKDFVLHAGISLPQSSAQNPFKTAVNLAITDNAVLVEGHEIYRLSKGKVKESDVDAGKIEIITQAVKKAWSTTKLEKSDEDIVVIQADKRIPYRTIHLVMRSAAHSGFYRFRLAIEKE